MEILPVGSVVFDSIGEEQYEGVVRKPMIRSFTHGRGKEVSSGCGLPLVGPPTPAVRPTAQSVGS